MTRCETEHTVFYRHSSARCVYLIVYVDDTVLTGNDHHGISQMKQHLCHHFQTKNLGKLRYFLGIEIAQSNDGIIIYQWKYALDILEEIGLMNSKPLTHPWILIANSYQIRESLFQILSSIEDRLEN